jgi:HPt (histidine-containing phosphotransfer) domain-containing protein
MTQAVVVLDLHQLNGISRGDKKFEREWLAVFVKEAGAFEAALEDHVAQGRSEEVRKIAHTLRGSSATVGARRLSRAVERLQLAASDDDKSSMALELLRVREEFRRLVTYLTEGGWMDSAGDKG